MKITSLVIAFLTLIVGGALIALAGVGVLSFPLGLILGSVLVLFSSIYLVSCCKFFTLKEMTMTCSVKSKINIWFEKQRNKDIEKALENPDLFGENKRNVGNRSARNQLEMILHETDGIILKKIYERNQNVLLFMNWVPKTIDHVDPESEIDIRKVVSCYKLIKACQPEFRSLISELLGAIRCGLRLLKHSKYQEQARTVSDEDAPLFCLTRSYYQDGYLTPLRAGPRDLINHYIHLRRRENPKHFFSPKHPCYYARLAFNDSVCVYRELFDIERLTKMYIEGDYSKEQEKNLQAILSFVKTLDEGKDFLIEHKDTDLIGRGFTDVFCT
ncbi:hypothetical protein X556_0623 [Chlamydia pneumoniae B21]|nr:hypothetical protein X556_0623 [Chlamydia pneumoniae B21]